MSCVLFNHQPTNPPTPHPFSQPQPPFPTAYAPSMNEKGRRERAMLFTTNQPPNLKAQSERMELKERKSHPSITRQSSEKPKRKNGYGMIHQDREMDACSRSGRLKGGKANGKRRKQGRHTTPPCPCPVSAHVINLRSRAGPDRLYYRETQRVEFFRPSMHADCCLLVLSPTITTNRTAY